MGDVGDFWRDVKAGQAQEKRERQEEAMLALPEIRRMLAPEVTITTFNGGNHWVFRRAAGTEIGQYWPSTMRALPKDGRSKSHHGVTLTQIVAWVKNRV